MNRKLIAAVCVVCCLGLTNILKAQELVATAGGYGIDGNTSLGWSVGQLAIQTLTTSETILTQGFHQSSIVVTAIENRISDMYRIQVYPNPTESQLIITTEDPHSKLNGFIVLLYDMQGSIVLRRTGSLDTMTIDMEEYASSVYFLKVVDPDNLFEKSFHIVKQ